MDHMLMKVKLERTDPCAHLAPSAARRGAPGALHSRARHELVSAVRQGCGLSARHEAQGPHPPGPQAAQVRKKICYVGYNGNMRLMPCHFTTICDVFTGFNYNILYYKYN